MCKLKFSMFIFLIVFLNGIIMSQPLPNPLKNQSQKVLVNTTNSLYSKLRPVPIPAVTMMDGFWKKRILSNTNNSILKLLELLEAHGVMDNFKRLYIKMEVKRKGYVFADSDIYKWLEAASYSLLYDITGTIKKEIDRIIDEIAPAQGDDGYLNTYYVDERVKDRFTKLETDHELYCAGHLIQAAIANKRITGENKLFNIAKKYADYICNSFGPNKINNTDGHPEIEMAMIELYRETGDKKYLEMAHFFLNVKNYKNFHEITGHAVRAGYFNCGITDYYIETGDKEALSSVQDQWNDMLDGKMYITGGVGSRGYTEGFGRKYELPNEAAYAETCAGLASVFWNWRMLSANPDAKYSDLIEKTFYNLFLSGVSLDGTHYFYENPLYCSNKKEFDPWYKWAQAEPPKRKEWYDCTCCPPNIERTFASLPGYFYSTSKEGVWIHFYDNNELNWKLDDGSSLNIKQETKYPWDGIINIKINSNSKEEFSVFVRLPEWSKKAIISINNNILAETSKTGTYYEIRRKWSNNDQICLSLEMPIRLVQSDIRLADTRNCIAVQRGPVIFCLEECDNSKLEFNSIRAGINEEGELIDQKVHYDEKLLDGVSVIEFKGLYPTSTDMQGPLYRFIEDEKKISFNTIKITAIPYYAWNNRGNGQMTVWMLKK
jgi:uncharacterized protein